MVEAIVQPFMNILKRDVGPDDRVREYNAMYAELERRAPGLNRANENDIRTDPLLAVTLYREAAESMGNGYAVERNEALKLVVRQILDEPGLYRSRPSQAFFQLAQNYSEAAGLFHMVNLVVIDQGRVISRGGSAVVRRAVNLANMKLVAAKIITDGEDGVGTREEQQEKIMSRIIIHMDAQGLEPELFVNVLETHMCDGVELDGALAVIVMEYAPHTLMELVKEHNKQLDIAYVKQVMLFLAKLLRALSQNDPTIVHRGITPHHILLLSSLDTEPSKMVFKLTDFGQSRTVASGIMGTIVPCMPTLAPEVIGNDKTYTLRSEMWSTGATMFYVLTGFYPVDPGVFPVMSRTYRELKEDQDWFAQRLAKVVRRRLIDTDFYDIAALIEPCLRVACPEDHVDPCAADAQCRQPGFKERWCRECFISATYQLFELDEPDTSPPNREARLQQENRRLTLELAAARAQLATSEADLAQLRTLHDTLKRTFVGLVVHLNRWKRCLETIRPAVQAAVQANGVADDAADVISLALVAADETSLLEVPPHQGDVSDSLAFAFGRGLPTRANAHEACLQDDAMLALNNILLTL